MAGLLPIPGGQDALEGRYGPRQRARKACCRQPFFLISRREENNQMFFAQDTSRNVY